MNYDDDKIIAKLLELNIDEFESRVFLHLLRVGPVRAGSITSALQYDRNIVYRILVKLKNKGLVISTFSNPPLYLAANPEDAIRAILIRIEEDFLLAKKNGHEVIKYLKNIKHNTDPKNELDAFTIIQGKRNVYTRIGRMIKEAENPVYIISIEEGLARMYHTTIPNEINQLAKRTDVRLLLPNMTKVESIVSSFRSAEIRCGMLPSSGIIILEEGIQLMMSGNANNNTIDSEFSVIHTNNSGFVSNIQYLCKNLWDMASPIDSEKKINAK